MNKSVITVALSLGLLGATSVFAGVSKEKAYVESYRGRSDMPVPLTVVTPSVNREYAGKTVELEFVVDQNGTPRNIRVRDQVDRDLEDRLTAAVAKWRFAPQRSESGEPVACTVILPMVVVDSTAPRHTLAMQ